MASIMSLAQNLPCQQELAALLAAQPAQSWAASWTEMVTGMFSLCRYVSLFVQTAQCQ
jgi:hypothetical protein